MVAFGADFGLDFGTFGNHFKVWGGPGRPFGGSKTNLDAYTSKKGEVPIGVVPFGPKKWSPEGLRSGQEDPQMGSGWAKKRSKRPFERKTVKTSKNDDTLD